MITERFYLVSFSTTGTAGTAGMAYSVIDRIKTDTNGGTLAQATVCQCATEEGAQIVTICLNTTWLNFLIAVLGIEEIKTEKIKIMPISDFIAKYGIDPEMTKH